MDNGMISYANDLRVCHAGALLLYPFIPARVRVHPARFSTLSLPATSAQFLFSPMRQSHSTISSWLLLQLS